MSSTSQALDQRYAALFRQFDADGSGALSRDELVALFLHFGGDQISPSEIVGLFKTFDRDGSDTIELKEFLMMCRALKFETYIERIERIRAQSAARLQQRASSPSARPTSAAATGADWRGRVIAMYSKYAPDKLSNVDAALAKYRGEEATLMQFLVDKYGPEPVVAGKPVPALSAASPQRVAPLRPSATPAEVTEHYRQRLNNLYETYDFSKLHLVEPALVKFRTREEREAVLERLVQKYGPEPGADAAAAARR